MAIIRGDTESHFFLSWLVVGLLLFLLLAGRCCCSQESTTLTIQSVNILYIPKTVTFLLPWLKLTVACVHYDVNKKYMGHFVENLTQFLCQSPSIGSLNGMAITQLRRYCRCSSGLKFNTLLITDLIHWGDPLRPFPCQVRAWFSDIGSFCCVLLLQPSAHTSYFF